MTSVCENLDGVICQGDVIGCSCIEARLTSTSAPRHSPVPRQSHDRAAVTGEIAFVDLRSQEGLVQRGASIYGNFNSRSIAWKRGSLRKGSRSGTVFRFSRPGSRSRNAVSSHSSAWARLPHCA